MSLPRLKNAKQAEAKLNRVSKTKLSASSTSKKSADREPVDDGALAKEADILSLLTVLNAPVMNEELPTTLQAIKAALYARDYVAAFSRHDYLQAYCARWVPGRALAYRNLLVNNDYIVSLFQKQSQRRKPFNVICVGGGAGSEVMAFASLAHEADLENPTPMSLVAIDSADWTPVLDGMSKLLAERWKLEEEAFRLTFRYQDVLNTFEGMTEEFTSVNVITSLFTTNELFASSRPKTLAFLTFLSKTCKSGTLLLVVESVGTYSEISVAGKVYPLELVLDQTLCGRAGQWKLVEKDEGKWYRVPEESKRRYQLQLENTHMLVRLYEKV